MPSITNLVPTTETEAVNAMLAAVGETPVADITATTPDLQIAVGVLRNATRGVLTHGWRFNTELFYPHPAVGAVTEGGIARPVFVEPTGFLRWRIANTADQAGYDPFVRLNRTYTGAPLGTIRILADRQTGRDGLTVPGFETLHLEVAHPMNFEQMPECARWYVTVLAARQYAEQRLGSADRAKFAAADEQAALAALTEFDRPRVLPPQAGATVVSELDAVNTVLHAANLELAPSLDYSLSDDASHALRVVRTVTRAMQEEGWQFNSEFGREVSPSAQYTWVDTAGVSTVLNVFKVPANTLRWDLTSTSKQACTSACERVSRKYTEASAAVPVIYDSTLNRDGFKAADFPYLYIDRVFEVTFSVLPATARDFVVARATLEFAEQRNLPLAQTAQATALLALRALKRDQGDSEQFNLFDNADTQQAFGLSRRRSSLTSIRRTYPGPT
jgi:hypothetical protein